MNKFDQLFSYVSVSSLQLRPIIVRNLLTSGIRSVGFGIVLLLLVVVVVDSNLLDVVVRSRRGNMLSSSFFFFRYFVLWFFTVVLFGRYLTLLVCDLKTPAAM